MPTQNQTISWQAPEFRHYEKNMGWYVTLIGITILIVGFFVIQQDLFAAITSGILGLVTIFFARQKPEIVPIELNGKGVYFGNVFFPYKQLKYFWVVSTPNHRTVNFHAATYINNVIILELEDQDPDEVHEFLSRYLPEHTETSETLIQKISHKLKF